MTAANNAYPNKELTHSHGCDAYPCNNHRSGTRTDCQCKKCPESLHWRPIYGHMGLVLDAAAYAALNAANPPPCICNSTFHGIPIGRQCCWNNEWGRASSIIAPLRYHHREVRERTLRGHTEWLAPPTMAAIHPMFLAGLAATKAYGIGGCNVIIESIADLRANYGTVN